MSLKPVKLFCERHRNNNSPDSLTAVSRKPPTVGGFFLVPNAKGCVTLNSNASFIWESAINSSFQIDLKHFAIVIVLFASVAAMIRYVVMFGTLGFTGSNVISAVLGLVGFSLCAGLLNKGSFSTMVISFFFGAIALMIFSR